MSNMAFLAEFYNKQLGQSVARIREAVAGLNPESVSYKQYLDVKTAFEQLTQDLMSRDVFGVHCEDIEVCLKFRNMRHPEQPIENPAQTDAA